MPLISPSFLDVYGQGPISCHFFPMTKWKFYFINIERLLLPLLLPLLFSSIFHSPEYEQSEVKGIKKGINLFCPSVYGWEGMSLCACLSRLKSWITFDGMKGSWWNFQDQSNSVQLGFGQWSWISLPPGYGPGFVYLSMLPSIGSK